MNAHVEHIGDDRPVIGICAAFETASWSFWTQPAHLVAASYVRDIQRGDALAVLLPLEPRDPRVLLERIDGLLVIGGADVDPSTYGAERDPATEVTAPDRDDFEVTLVRAANAAGMPVLGICRGMQIINVARGGTLRQDLRNAAGATPHRKRLGGFDGTDRLVALADASLALRAIGSATHRAHCHHHQAIDTLGEGLAVTGWATDDDVPEALEATDGSWLLGVQWHPEAAPDGDLVRAFVRACRAHAASELHTHDDAAPTV